MNRDLCVAVLLVAWLGWQLVAGVVDLGRDFVTGRSISYRLALAGSPEERIERYLGEDHLLFRTVRDAVPERAFVTCALRSDLEGATRADLDRLNRVQALRHLLFPRLLLNFVDPVQSVEDMAPPGMDVYLLRFAGESPPADRPHWSELLAADRVAIWHYRREP